MRSRMIMRSGKQVGSLPERTIGIEDLPEEVLGLIIQHLQQWRQRVRVELVSRRWRRVALNHGWANLKYFSTWDEAQRGLCWQPAWFKPLLSRAGRHITALQLEFINRAEDKGTPVDIDEEFLALLSKCPNVKHLSVYWDQLNGRPATLELIRHNYASQLKSLQILHLLSYTRLRHLALRRSQYPSSYTQNFSEKNLELLALLPGLCSLVLVPYFPLKDLSFLQHLPHLEHLEVQVSTDNIGSFINALPHLAAKGLKALCVQGLLGSNDELERFIKAIATHLASGLEHLGFHVEHGGMGRLEGVKHLFDPLATLGSLRSLTIEGNLVTQYYADEEGIDWRWLEQLSTNMEYLEFGSAPPLATICNVARNAKNSLHMRIGKNRGQDNASVPKWHDSAGMTSGQGFIPAVEIPSHVLQRYRYGCLSEGMPAFARDSDIISED